MCMCIRVCACVHACTPLGPTVTTETRSPGDTPTTTMSPLVCRDRYHCCIVSLEGYGMGVLITRMYLFTCVHACVSICMCVCEIGAWGACALYACMQMYVCSHVHACVHVRVHVCVRVCVCACFVMGYGL